MDRLLRARVVFSEAQALGLSVQDLVAAAAGAPATREDVPTVAEYLRRVEPTFSKGTHRTYRSYWRLAEKHFGDRRIDTISVDDCEEVVLAVAERARQKRPDSDARSPGRTAWPRCGRCSSGPAGRSTCWRARPRS